MAMGGVGEAAMLGAVMGGGSAMLTGADPLKGALMGGLTGGAGAGISGMLPGAAGAVAPGVIIPPPVVDPTAAINPAVTANAAFNSAATALPNAVDAAINPTFAQNLPGVAPSGINVLPNGLPPDISNSILGKIAPNSVMPSAVAAPSAVVPSGVAPTSLSNLSNIGEFIKPSYSIAPPINPANSAAAAPVAAAPATPAPPSTFMEGVAKFAKDPMSSLMNNKFSAAGSALAGASQKKKKEEEEEYSGPLSRFKYNPDAYRPSGYADGGIANLGGYDRMVGEQPMYMSNMAAGGIANLGSYSDGGRMLRGPGDGMSDSIPASISGKRPARLADGEFVIPADVVSHLGNGSTDAGAKQLYAMMDKVRKARTGRKAQGREINPRQYMAA